MQILYLLEGLRTPFFDGLLSALTYLGDEVVFIVLALFIYWCVDKRWGCYVLAVSFLSTLLNQFLKIVCQVPRPWVRDPAFTIVESARAGATGYSFPSGHAANITGTLGSWARFTKKTWLRVLCIVGILAVSFSRMYLGVHYPSDVLFSLVVGIILVLAFYPIFRNAQDDPRRIRITFAAIVVLALCSALYTELRDWGSNIDADNLTEATKNAWLLTGGGAGMLFGIWVEDKYIHFPTQAPWWAQLLKLVLGLALVMGIRMGLKAILPASLWCNALRYLCMVLFAACVWPLTFPWFARGCKKAAA